MNFEKATHDIVPAKRQIVTLLIAFMASIGGMLLQAGEPMPMTYTGVKGTLHVDDEQENANQATDAD